jgi:hypothetical protein
MTSVDIAKIIVIADSMMTHLPHKLSGTGPKGPKSKWSAHDKMAEAGVHGKLCQDFEDLTQEILPMFPEHWDMSTYGFYPHKSGAQARWSDKKGKGHGGILINICPYDIFQFLGFLTGILQEATVKDTHTKKQLAYYENFKASFYSFKNSFSKYTNSMRQSVGLNPKDACAQTLVKDSSYTNYYKPYNLKISETLTPEQLLRRGKSAGKSKFKDELNWGITHFLWKKVQNHSALKHFKLTLDMSSLDSFAVQKLVELDEVLISTLALADLIMDSDYPKIMKNYLVITPHSTQHKTSNKVRAWSSESSLFLEIIRVLKMSNMPLNLEYWRVHELSEDSGHKVRHIFQNNRFTHD